MSKVDPFEEGGEKTKDVRFMSNAKLIRLTSLTVYLILLPSSEDGNIILNKRFKKYGCVRKIGHLGK